MKYPGKMLHEVLSHVGKTPATVKYPVEQAHLADRFRGQIRFIAENCVGCGLCEKDCPALAIEIVEVSKKKFEAVFHLDRCIYCSQCVLSCRKGALETSSVFELAAIDRRRLKVVFRAQPTPPGEPAAAATDPAAAVDDAPEPEPGQ